MSAGSSTTQQQPKLVKCEQCKVEFDPRTARSTTECIYHWGNYGLCGLIKRGIGWSCCGRELNERGCRTGQHVGGGAEPAPRKPSLRDNLDQYMAVTNQATVPPKPSAPSSAGKSTQDPGPEEVKAEEGEGGTKASPKAKEPPAPTNTEPAPKANAPSPKAKPKAKPKPKPKATLSGKAAKVNTPVDSQPSSVAKGPDRACSRERQERPDSGTTKFEQQRRMPARK